MNSQHVVIVGAGLAGLRTAEALRRLGNDARITLVGGELGLPYDRPPLSKAVLLGKIDATGVALSTAAALAELEVDVRLGTHAVSLDAAERRLTLDDGSTLDYDAAVLATGSSARRLPHLAELDGVHVLRTVDDAVGLRKGLEAQPRVAVIGGGFIGAEVASSARSLGLDVTIIDTLPVLMQRGLGDLIGARLTKFHEDAGVQLRLGAQVDGLVGDTRVEGVRLAGGEVIPADLVVVGVGAAPNTDWLAGSGLEIADGIICDEYLAAAPGAYAVGDVARWHHRLYDETVRMEHWTSAIEHAGAVAATLTGAPTPCMQVPYVWSDQHGAKLQLAGRLQAGDELRYVIDEPMKFLAVAGSDGKQHAALAMNAPGQLIRQRMKLADSPPWPPAD